MRILSRSQLQQLIPMEHAIGAVANAFGQLAYGTAQVPLRSHIAMGPHSGLALIMPAYLQQSGALGVKLLTLFPQNAGTHRPTIQAMVALFDTANGMPLALLEGSYLTALRTGAASGVATQHMARDDARVMTLFGAGAQALFQVWAVCTVRPIERVWIINRTATRAETLADQLRAFGPPIPADVRIATGASQALREADVVCCATASPSPVFDAADVSDGTHINGVGSYLATMQEVPAATVARARVVVDQREAAWAEAGDLIIPRSQGLFGDEQIIAELGEVVTGTVAGRTNDDEITFFKSVGNAVQDTAVAQLAFTLACEQGVGTEADLF